MYWALLICVILIILLAIATIIIMLKKHKTVENDSVMSITESRQKLSFSTIWIVILSIVFVLAIVCVTWQIGKLNKTLQSIDEKLSGLNNNLSGINVTMSDMDKNLDYIFQVLRNR
jgi:hypothetical protein